MFLGFFGAPILNILVALQKHYSMLQALALHRELEDVEDSTMPMTERIDRKIGTLAEELKELCNVRDEDLVSEVRKPPPKRKPAEGDSSPRAKLPKKGQSVEEAHEAGNLSKLTIPVLKEFLVSKGIRPEKKKAELVAQVDHYLNTL